MMNAYREWGDECARPGRWRPTAGIAAVGLAFCLVGFAVVLYDVCKIEVETGQQAVLIRKAGLDLEPGMELAPPPREGVYYKGIQTDVLTERRLLQPDLLVLGDRQAVRGPQRQGRHPDQPERRGSPLGSGPGQDRPEGNPVRNSQAGAVSVQPVRRVDRARGPGHDPGRFPRG